MARVLGLAQPGCDKRPTLTDLRESGDLKNTADSVLGVCRDEMDHPESSEAWRANCSQEAAAGPRRGDEPPTGAGAREPPGFAHG